MLTRVFEGLNDGIVAGLLEMSIRPNMKGQKRPKLLLDRGYFGADTKAARLRLQRATAMMNDAGLKGKGALWSQKGR